MFATWMPPKYKTLPTVICILYICHFFGSSAILGSIINQLVTQNLKGLQGTLWPICYKLYEEKLLVTFSYIQLTPFSHVIIYVLLRRQINKFSHCSWRRFGKMWFFDLYMSGDEAGQLNLLMSIITYFLEELRFTWVKPFIRLWFLDWSCQNLAKNLFWKNLIPLNMVRSAHRKMNIYFIHRNSCDEIDMHSV